MKKVILSALPLLVCTSSIAFAAIGDGGGTGTGTSTDTIRAQLNWNYDLPVVVPGQSFTFTGEGGQDLGAGQLQVFADGTYKSKPLTLELHSFDNDSMKTGGLVKLGKADKNGNTVNKLTFTVEDDSTSFTSTDGSDLSTVASNAVVKMDGDIVEEAGSDAQSAITQWTIEGQGMPKLNAGSTITASTYIMADLEFADS